jgi:hypothetical protein
MTKPTRASEIPTGGNDDPAPEHRGLVRAGEIDIEAPDDEERARIAAHRAVQSKKARQQALRKATADSHGSPDLFERLERRRGQG